MKPRYKDLYEPYVDKCKHTSDTQCLGCCPFHDDTNPSFTFNIDSGCYYCFGCDASGNAPQFAELKGLNPTDWYEKDTTYIYTKPSFEAESIGSAEKHSLSTIDYTKKMNQFIENLKNDMSLFDNDVWDKSLIDDLSIGLDNGVLCFGYYDDDGKCIGIKYHKPSRWDGDGKKKWYPSNKIAKYSPNKPIYICEGEKDVITLISSGFQAITSSGGCSSIPNELKWLNQYKDITTIYDLDDGGLKGGNKMANAIVDSNPRLSVKVAKWDDSFDKGFDVTDSFKLDGGVSFTRAINTYDVIESKSKPKSLKMIKLKEFMKETYEPTEAIIESILYKGQPTIIGGDTGTKKSFIGLQCALSIASGIPLFDYFKVTPQKVFLVQFENENFDMQSRSMQMSKYFTKKVGNDDWLDNVDISVVPNDVELFVNNWDKIVETLDEYEFNDGVLIVDNLYTSTDKEIQDNHECTKLLSQIHSVGKKYNLSQILIAHSNKGVAISKKLDKDQLQGGKTIINSMASVVLTDNSRISQDLNIMKIVKGGRSAKNELQNIPFKLKFQDDYCIFKKGSIIKNEALHFEESTTKWEVRLIKEVSESIEMQREIIWDRDTFKRNLPQEFEDMGDTKLTRLLNRLMDWGLVNRHSHNQYQLMQTEIDDLC